MVMQGRIVGKAISADSPAHFHVAHCEVNPEKGRRLKRLNNAPFVPGKDRIEHQRRLADDDAKGATLGRTVRSMRAPPSSPSVRSRDATSFEFAHAAVRAGKG